jgi:hypothetical protein
MPWLRRRGRRLLLPADADEAPPSATLLARSLATAGRSSLGGRRRDHIPPASPASHRGRGLYPAGLLGCSTIKGSRLTCSLLLHRRHRPSAAVARSTTPSPQSRAHAPSPFSPTTHPRPHTRTHTHTHTHTTPPPHLSSADLHHLRPSGIRKAAAAKARRAPPLSPPPLPSPPPLSDRDVAERCEQSRPRPQIEVRDRQPGSSTSPSRGARPVAERRTRARREKEQSGVLLPLSLSPPAAHHARAPLLPLTSPPRRA